MSSPPRVHVIACGVLGIDIRSVAERLGVPVATTFLEAGLHDRPGELRRRLQAAIDLASADGGCDRIAVGYGICGRGTVGIQARAVPLAIPKAHDCIALFLGSDAAYRREFARFPGTYYVSAGWYEGKVQPRGQKKQAPASRDTARGFDALAAKYGEENARAIVEFLSSWQRNYQRAAFIDTGAPARERYASYARAMAEEFGWQFEELPGSLSLLGKMLTAEATTREVLVVPPHHVTVFDPIESGLAAAPVWEQGHGPESAGQLSETPPSLDPSSISARRAARQHHEPGRERSEERAGAPVRIGLGIDAGGTYTDVVVYDFEARAILAKSKALTTRWRYAEGIDQALAALDHALLGPTGLVALSTTLATNAIVEGDGQRVGLLVLPPYGLFRPSDIPHEPKAVLSARLEIDGTELAPVDPAEVARAADHLVQRGVGAFAVSGYAGTINPAHELEIKRLLRERTRLSVTCGHELSDLLNFRTRADTAVLNARIIPRLERLIREVEQSLRRRGIDAPIMVVKGDGSLMSAATARERPIETILSGPAASVAGARFLTGRADALVVDMGGTTTDTAAVRGGTVRVCGDGARVGGWKTHVQALDMRTTGLGGDSLIAWEDGELNIGPARVAPVAWTAAEQPHAALALGYLEARIDDYAASSRPMELLLRTGHPADLAVGERERSILDVLAERPHSLAELAGRLGVADPVLLPLGRLEEHYAVQRCGLTPTDLLHVRGDFVRWAAEAARRLCGMIAHVVGMAPDALIDHVLERMVARMAVELLKKQLDEETDPDAMDDCPACQALVGNLLAGGSDAYRVRVRLERPVVGLGAPVHLFLPRAARLLDTEAIIPPDADVANAIGAITSSVVVTRRAHIRPNEVGEYAVHGLPAARTFARFDDAQAYAVAELERLVRGLALAAGTRARHVQTEAADKTAATADGSTIFLERTLTAHLAGPPDAAPTRQPA